MKRNACRLLLGALSLTIVATACGGGGSKAQAQTTSWLKKDSKDVKPPPAPDAKSFAQPGLILATNSHTWHELTETPVGSGVVVLFVQPGGPSASHGIRRGDLLVRVDGQKVTNKENALAVLQSTKGQTRHLTFVRRNGKEATIDIQALYPTHRARPYLDQEIAGNPTDPVLRYLRATSGAGGTIKSDLDDLAAALQARPQFPEALTQRSFIVWSERSITKDKNEQTSLANQALAGWQNALDLDPRDTEALALRASAYTTLGKPQLAKADADTAVKIDATFAAALGALAQADLALNHPQQAAGPARAAIDANPTGNLTYYRLLALVFKQLKRKPDCQTTYRAIVPRLRGTGVASLQQEANLLETQANTNCG